jgi:16S rRNA (guanine527-N7)-methyltransferase
MTTSFEASLRARCERAEVQLSSRQIDQLQRYYFLLQRWNRRINLTALPLEDFPDSTLDRLLVEPLAAARLLGEERSDWVDLGSGGGSPAIPLKVVRPQFRLTMTESRTRKAAFLREAARELDWKDVEVFPGRFEALEGASSAKFILATTRAVRLDEATLRLIGRLLRPGASFLAFGLIQGIDLKGFEVVETIALPGGTTATRLMSRASEA